MSDRIKIGVVCYPSHGGSGIVATELGLALAAKGCEVHFISYAPPVRLRGYAENVQFHQVFTDNYPVFHHPPYTLSLASKIVEVAELHDLDLIHAHYAVPHATCAFLARQMLGGRLKTVTTLHGTDITLVGVQPSFHPIVRFSIEQSDGVTVVSDWLLGRTIDAFGLTKPIEVIPNFVDTKRFAPRSGECGGPFAMPDRKVIMHASNFRRVKNIPGVIGVFRRIREAIPSNLILIGEGPELAHARELVRLYELDRDVYFLGIQDVIEEIFPCVDLLLLPSEHESFGLVALEAMSCGVPVVATNQGGTREVIDSGTTGFLADPSQHEEMARWAIDLLRDPVRWSEVSRAARARAVERFDEDRVVDRYLAFYRSVLG